MEFDLQMVFINMSLFISYTYHVINNIKNNIKKLVLKMRKLISQTEYIQILIKESANTTNLKYLYLLNH